MPVITKSASIKERIQLRRPRNHLIFPISETDPNPFPQIISPAIPAIDKKKNGFSSTTFRGLGCPAVASQQVSVPAVIRSSADWQGKKTRDRKSKKTSKNKNHQGNLNSNLISNVNSASCLDFQDVWCGPGIGFSSVDCVVARRNLSNRSKIDGEPMNQREIG